MAKSFGHPDIAMGLRDHLDSLVKDIVNKVRPAGQAGVVLSVAPGGPNFRVAEADSVPVADQPPPEGPGNPRQIYYANVRLDNGEVISARVNENIPLCRNATWWDPDNPSGSAPYMIVNDVYRYTTNVVRTDESGMGYLSTEPDLTRHVSGSPYVPPRVLVEGSAGKYVIVNIIRGMIAFEGAVLRASQQVNASRAGEFTFDGNTQLKIYSSERSYNQQGWLGGTGWIATSGFELLLISGSSYQRFVVHPNQINSEEYGKWLIVPAVEENYVNRNVGALSDQFQNVLLARLDAGLLMHFYVANRSLQNFSEAPDSYLNGIVVIRSLLGELTPSIVSFPGIDLGTLKNETWGYTTSIPIRTDIVDYSLPQNASKFSSDLDALKNSLTGGGGVVASIDGAGAYRLKWTSKFIMVTAQSIHKSSGVLDVTMPPVGTEVTVVGALYGDGDPNATRTVTTDGFDLSGYCSLYYAVQIGANTGSASLPQNFVIVLGTAAFDIPDGWVMIAVHNTDTASPAFKLGTGNELDVWHVLSAGSSGLADNPGQPPRYKKQNGLVVFRGGFQNLSGSTVASATNFGTVLPVGFRPGDTYRGASLYFTGTSVIDRFDVLSTGGMTLRRALGTNDQLFLDSISYPAEG